jgi:hypothetical protein
MFNKVDNSRPCLSLRKSFVLLMVVCSLAAHFVSDGLAIQGEQGMSDLAAREGPTHADLEGCDDDLVLPSPGVLASEYSLTWPVSQASIRNLSVALSPRLPPPNS